MAPEFPKLAAKRLTGSETFSAGDRELDFDIRSFWSWSASDLMSNATRGVLAEFLVAQALGIATDSVRQEWDPYDLVAPDGTKVEVKSSSYIQTWFQRNYSTISFGVPKTRTWDPETGGGSNEPKRQADVYVFCLLFHRDQDTVNPCDVSQWKFWVLPTSVLDRRERSQHSITLKSLESLCKAVPYRELATAIQEAAKS